MGKNKIDIWWVDAEKVNFNSLKKFEHILSKHEIEKFEKLFFPNDRHYYFISHVALRIILSRYIDMLPEAIIYTYNCFGKPSVEGKIYFNMSHSRNKICIAVYKNDIGVDIEYIDSHFDYLHVAKFYFSEKEYTYIFTHKENTKKTKEFYRIWCMKEALLKALGTGLVETPHFICYPEIKNAVFIHNNYWSLTEINTYDKNFIGYIAYKNLEKVKVDYFLFENFSTKLF